MYGISRLRSRARGWSAVVSAYWYTLGKADDTDPTFWADFANDRYAVNGAEEVFTDIFTFTRSTTGTYFDANGVMQIAAINTPRFDHDPLTGEKLGLLIEEQRTNLSLYSDFSTKTVIGGTALNSGVAPLPTDSYLLFTEDTSTGAHGVSPDSGNNTNFTSGTTYTISVYVRRGTANVVQISGGYPFSANFYANFDFTTETIVSSGSSVVSSTVQKIGVDAYRLAIRGVATAAGGSRGAYVYLVNDNTSATIRPSYTGTGKTVYMWGVQCEVGSFATSYIPTTSAAVTRTSDTLTANASNVIPFASWYNQVFGSLYVHHRPLSTTADRIFRLSGGSAYYDTAPSGGLLYYRAYVGGSFVWNLNKSIPNTDTKDFFFYKTNDSGWCRDGGAVGVDTACPISSLITTFSCTNKNGYIKELRYYPIRVSNPELQRITT